MSQNTKSKTGIVLSGGAVRCFGHLGVLKALNEHDIYPDIISGVSAGAIVGVFYAEGRSPDEILDLFLNKRLMNFIEINFSKGLASMNKLRKRLEELLKAREFGDLQRKLVVSATNINTAKVVTFDEGTLIDKIMASSSIPVLFKPIEIDGEYYVDGGVMNNMPIEPISGLCDRIIGVNVNPLGYRKKFENLIDIAERTFHLTIMANFINKRDKFDVYIEPEELENFGLFNLKQGEDIFKAGYTFTRKLLKDKQIKL